MTAQTPEERLAEVLERHEEFRWLNDGPGDGVVCDCGHVIPERDSGYVVDWHRDHLAAAILAHLVAEGWAQINAPKGPVHPQLRAAKWPTRREPVE